MNTNKKILTGMILITLLVMISINATQCNDGIDNDLDGKIDYPEDNGCSNLNDRTESIKLGYADGCLVRGDKLKDVFGRITKNCNSDRCSVCVLMTEAGNYTTSFHKCDDLPKCGFSGSQGPIDLDITPPILTITSPTNNQIFSSRKVEFNININEPSSLYYIDNINGRGRWKRMGTKLLTYQKSLSFKDGLNDITIKATDRNNNPTEITKQFYVDSKKPKFKKTYPKKKSFASGLFEVQFDEANPKTLTLYYGNSQSSLNITTHCEIIKKKYYCSKQISLTQYNNQQIQYYFELTDIADNTVQSKPILVNVDTQEPILLNPNSFWTQGQGRNSKYIYFNIEINEPNLDQVTYFYEDNRGRLKEKKLCSRLKNNMCTKKIRMKIDEVLLNIQIVDEAGNIKVEPIGFLMEY
jgi:hypothetical protein